jgi:hypothetical protein
MVLELLQTLAGLQSNKIDANPVDIRSNISEYFS